MQKHYEIMLAIRGSLVESEAAAAYKEFLEYLNKNGAQISYEESWGKMKLAYSIKKESEAYYSLLRLQFDGAKIAALETFMQIDRNIIRSLVSTVEDTEAEIFTKAMYDAGLEQFYADKETRRKRAAPKTRATTTKQLEEDMKTKPKAKSLAEQVDDMLGE